MDMEAQVREAILDELTRQAETGGLTVEPDDEGAVTLNGRVDLETLAMAVVGAVAGGP
ncbi:MAG: hypothetical protein KY449_07450 [Proteobacteria bacterium]|nr:hypothetical protein [Pseudomonadota bacterium]